MKALLVIDMLNDFLDERGALFCGKDSRKIIPFIKKKIDYFHRKRNPVIFICDSHKEDDLEFKIFPKHAIKRKWGSKIIGELKVRKNDVIVKKKRYSGFFGTKLARSLKEKRINEAQTCGVCTSICVMDTVGDLRDRDIKTTVFKNGISDFDKEAHKFALKRMEKIYGAKIV